MKEFEKKLQQEENCIKEVRCWATLWHTKGGRGVEEICIFEWINPFVAAKDSIGNINSPNNTQHASETVQNENGFGEEEMDEGNDKDDDDDEDDVNIENIKDNSKEHYEIKQNTTKSKDPK